MTDFLARLSLLGDGLLAWLVPALLWTAALLVLVRAVDELLSRRVSASWRLALYAVVLLRLALPTGWVTPLGVLPGAEAVAPATPTTRVSTEPAAPVPVLPPLPLIAATPRIAWTASLPVVWSIGAIAMLAWMLHSRRRLERELVGARVAREGVAQLAPGRRALEHDHVGPAVAGVLRPRIVIPTALIDLLGRRELAALMRHESAHVDRRDPLLQAGVQLTLALLWPVLPLWLAAHRVRQLVEQACDERALEGREASERAACGEALLAVATAGPVPVRPALGSLRFGAALRSRLVALRHACRWPSLVQGALVCLTLLALVASAGTRPSARAAADALGKDAVPPRAGLSGGAAIGLTVSREWESVATRTVLVDLAELAGLELQMPPALGTQKISVSMAGVHWDTVTHQALRSAQLHGRVAGEKLIVVPGRGGALWPQLPRELENLLGGVMASIRGEASVGWGNFSWDGGRLSMEGTAGTRKDLKLLRKALLELRCSNDRATNCFEDLSVERDASVTPTWRPADAAAPRPFGFRLRAGWRAGSEWASLSLEATPRLPIAVREALAHLPLPDGVQAALSEVRRSALSKLPFRSQETAWIATRSTSFESGVLTLEGRIGTEEHHVAFFVAMAEHPRFTDLAGGMTEESEPGLAFRLQASWVPDPSTSTGLIQLIERITNESGVEIQKISPGRRTPEGDYPLGLQGIAASSGSRANFEAALGTAFPNAEITLEEGSELADAAVELSCRLLLPPGLSPVASARRWRDSRLQVLIEFRIVEFASGVVLPSDW